MGRRPGIINDVSDIFRDAEGRQPLKASVASGGITHKQDNFATN